MGDRQAVEPVLRGRWRRLTAGLALVALSGAAGLVGLVGPTAAVADDEGEERPVEVTGSALYVAPITDAIPPTLTDSIPPAAVCVIQPELCPEQLDPVFNGIKGLLDLVLDNARDLPVQPVPPDTAAVSYFGGHPRYQTALTFELPPVPEGEELISYAVRIPQTQPSFDLNSPLFRGVVLAAFEFIGSGQDPQVLGEELVAALEETPIEVDGGVIGIEACPLLQAFEPAGAPLAADHREIPSREEDDELVPDVDCILGSGGVYDETTGDWVFDLAFAVNAWNEGELDNHGVLLRPTGAPNLAFGDPDTSTMAQVVLDLANVRATASSVEPFDPEDIPPLDDAPPLDEGDLADAPPFDDELDLGGAPLDEGFDAGGPPLDLGDDLGGADLPALEDPAAADAPEMPAEAPEVAEETLAIDQATAPSLPAGGPGWWVWLLVPAFLGGAYLTSTALLAPAAAAGAGQSGAFSRLLTSRTGGPPAAV